MFVQAGIHFMLWEILELLWIWFVYFAENHFTHVLKKSRRRAILTKFQHGGNPELLLREAMMARYVAICTNEDGIEVHIGRKPRRFRFGEVLETNRWYYGQLLERHSDDFAKWTPKLEAQLAAQGVATVSATDAAVELAVEHGLDIASIEGSGKDGRVTLADVKAAVGEV